ncbi:MAG: twin-arginine translocase subunit TatC [Chloroflexi bacterium]|nr:twin-arginine translocase subunit TatC [Chloroflexota bacterium]MCL5075096.1 twin-arginine translocase subunit TatC [Chloroflexota bacterium]
MDNEKRMSVIEHLEELRHRLIFCLIALAITTAFSLFFATQVFDLLLRPAPAGFKPIYTEMTEMFITYFKVALFTGAGLAMPVFVYHFIRFIAPALMPQERRYTLSLLPAVLLCFFSGAAFAYFVLLPYAIRYLLTFSGIAEPFIKIGNYISFATLILFWMGVGFETPLVMYFLAKIGVVSARKFASFRKYAFLGVFILAAIITPTPDPFNQSLVAIPLYLLFEIGILLAKLA